MTFDDPRLGQNDEIRRVKSVVRQPELDTLKAMPLQQTGLFLYLPLPHVGLPEEYERILRRSACKRIYKKIGITLGQVMFFWKRKNIKWGLRRRLSMD